MNSNRRYLNTLYTTPLTPQRIALLPLNENIGLSMLIHRGFKKINEMIEVFPNRYPVDIDVSEIHEGNQIRVRGTMTIDGVNLLIDETLSIMQGAPDKVYVNVFCDPRRPVVEISPTFMEPNWCTLYIINFEGGNIQSVIFNDLYAGMHNADPDAHPELMIQLENMVSEAIANFINIALDRLVVYDMYRDGELSSNTIDLTAYPTYADYKRLRIRGINGQGDLYEAQFDTGTDGQPWYFRLAAPSTYSTGTDFYSNNSSITLNFDGTTPQIGVSGTYLEYRILPTTATVTQSYQGSQLNSTIWNTYQRMVIPTMVYYTGKIEVAP